MVESFSKQSSAICSKQWSQECGSDGVETEVVAKNHIVRQSRKREAGESPVALTLLWLFLNLWPAKSCLWGTKLFYSNEQEPEGNPDARKLELKAGFPVATLSDIGQECKEFPSLQTFTGP